MKSIPRCGTKQGDHTSHFHTYIHVHTHTYVHTHASTHIRTHTCIQYTTHLLKNVKESLWHCSDVFMLEIGLFLLVALGDTLYLWNCKMMLGTAHCLLPAFHDAHPVAREYHQAVSQKASQQIAHSLLTNPGPSLVGTWLSFCSCWQLFFRVISYLSGHISRPASFIKTSRAFWGVVGWTVLHWSTNFKYLSNSTAFCTLILRGMDWIFPKRVGAMLQLTGKSADCYGRRNPSADSICPVLNHWKLHQWSSHCSQQVLPTHWVLLSRCKPA